MQTSVDYEKSLSKTYKNIHGIYYTPEHIVDDLLKDVNNINLTFCDPSCGSGNFIIGAIKRGFKPENIYGFDVDPIACQITRDRIKKSTGYKSNNIICKDFLTYDNGMKFDYIYTNPPWGKKLIKEEKLLYSRIFNKLYDTSALFFLKSLTCLKDKGELGLLLPEAFFNIAVFEDIRKELLNYNILRLVDYGQAFDGLITKAQAIILKNEFKENNNIKCNNYIRTTKSFKKLPKSIINLYTTSEDNEFIEQLYSIPHVKLKNNARWGLGIVTGNNAKYARDTPALGLIPVYKGSDIAKDYIKSPSLFIPNDLNLYQQVAPKELYEADEKIIYKFISSNLCFYLDKEQRYVLNSANFFILSKDFPLSSSQLLDLLNSNIMNNLFRKLFNTHKVLRGDLEELPIHYQYFKCNKEFTEKNYIEYIIEESK